jgi:serine protease Do
VRKVSRAFARENQLTDETGVVVLGVQSGYPAAEAGLGRGDIITKVGSVPLTALEKLKRIYETYEARPEPQLIEAQRNRHISLYVIKP